MKKLKKSISAENNNDIHDDPGFINSYNEELEKANIEVESGNYITHDEVKEFLKERKQELQHNLFDWSEDKEFVAELDERVRRWKEGIDRGYTWEETKAEIDARRKKRYPNS
jgi:hypothetical protein